MPGHEYDRTFFRYIEVGARRSAEVIVPAVQEMLPIASMADIGCGRGVWVAEWRNRGVSDAVGVDGEYVDAASLVIPPDRFQPQDLCRPFFLGRRFDLVQCLEVGEHLPAASAGIFVDNLVGHGDVVLFSAAPPGQGGEHHINEQPPEYWRGMFAQRGYLAFDPLRPAIRGRTEVEPWYRYNTLLFVRQERCQELPPAVRNRAIPPGAPITEMAPIPWRVRKFILARLPQPTVTQISVAKHNVLNVSRKLRGSWA